MQARCTRQAENAGFLLLDAETLHPVCSEILTVLPTEGTCYKSERMAAPERFAANVKRLLGDKSQRHLAQKLGVSPSLVSQWIKGATGTTLAQMDRIAEALGVDVGELLTDPSAVSLTEEKVAHSAAIPLSAPTESVSLPAPSQGVPHHDDSGDRALSDEVVRSISDAAAALSKAAAELARRRHTGTHGPSEPRRR